MKLQSKQMVNDTSFVTHESATDLQKWDTPKFIRLQSTCLKMDLEIWIANPSTRFRTEFYKQVSYNNLKFKKWTHHYNKS